jgi:hypothetical protein
MMERLPDGRFVPQTYPTFDLLPIAGLWRSGKWRTAPMSSARNAHRRLEAGHILGKMVLRI